MDSYDALKLLDDTADSLAATQGKRRQRADQFLTQMHARGWRICAGVPVPIPAGQDEPDGPELDLPAVAPIPPNEGQTA
ncbi:MAG TPA: hypothetical protein VMV33_17035 [Rhodocyclaceae bacterium]|nr:hypothetical protein [Rhodocyclaceae bacterium]